MTGMNSDSQNSRIGHLIQPQALAGKHLVVVGLGSGGFPVVQHLAMCGLINWTLVDKDILDEENLEKHIAMRKDIGRMKTEIAEEWIIDRNPDASVTRLDIDVTTVEGKQSLAAAIASADAVLCCTDNKNSRLQVNRICLANKTPCVTGLIYRTGFGGDCFLYDPDNSACYDCFLEQATEVSVERMMDSSKTISSTEDEMSKARYGRQADPKFGLSGLSVDIQFISLLMARMLLPVILDVPMNDENRSLHANSEVELTNREIHQLRIPYNYRGPSQPKVDDERTVWLDTTDGQRYGMVPKCPECGEVVDPDQDRFCSWCGHQLIDGESDNTEREWRAIPPPKDGFGYNHIVMISRRHLIDEIHEQENGNGKLSGNVHIALEPMTIAKNYVAALPDCRWCQEE